MVGLLQTFPTAVATYKFTLTYWVGWEGLTLPGKSEASKRSCAIRRFAECKSIQKSIVTLIPPSAEQLLSF